MTRPFDPPGAAPAPIGYFVHHQGRGHAERCAAVVNALPERRPVTIFSARDDIFPPLRPGVEVVRLPSLFEPRGDEMPADWVATPATLHCAPLGWPAIREAMATIATWFAREDPALIVSDVSAEIAQMARICSVPHVCVLQHGDRSDPGHQAAYEGAAGLLVPCDRRLAQPDWSAAMQAKACFAGGLGIHAAPADRGEARDRLGLAADRPVFVTISGGGGTGFASAPLAVGARAVPEGQWLTIGRVMRDWHGTEPGNLRHDGWVENVADYLAAADMVIASTGNTTTHQILAAGRPWLAVPEWRYFDEQVLKAEALARAGAATHLPHLPSSAHGWRDAIERARAGHDPALQAALVDPAADRHAARWLERLARRLRSAAPLPAEDTSPLATGAAE